MNRRSFTKLLCLVPFWRPKVEQENYYLGLPDTPDYLENYYNVCCKLGPFRVTAKDPDEQKYAEHFQIALNELCKRNEETLWQVPKDD